VLEASGRYDDTDGDGCTRGSGADERSSVESESLHAPIQTARVLSAR
jgi:hypothetical protein